jgi:DNA polymerase-3 subunit delta
MAETTHDITIRALTKELQAGRARPVYVLAGDERYLIDQVKNKLIDALINPQATDFDLSVFDTFKADAVQDALHTPPLLSEKKLVIVRQSDLFANTGSADHIDLSVLPDFSCLMLIEAKVLKSGAAKKRREQVMAAGGAFMTLSKQTAADLSIWLARLAKAAGMQLSRQAASRLIERMDSDMYALADALQRLMLYAQHEGETTIGETAIGLLIPAPLSVRIFDLMDAVSQKQAGIAFAIIDELLNQREAVPKISFMILRQIRQLIVARETGDPNLIKDTLKVPSFVARKIAAQARRFSDSQLYAIHSKGFDYDTNIRRGTIDDKTALFLLVAYACEAA